MSHGMEEHLEHAEHAQHAAHNPFDRRVAMSMAIVAAVLACVAMLSHRAHNETLQLQNEANLKQIEANICHTEATDQWNYYQAKSIKDLIYRIAPELTYFFPRNPGSQEQHRAWLAYLLSQHLGAQTMAPAGVPIGSLIQMTMAAKVSGFDLTILKQGQALEKWSYQVNKYKGELPKERAVAEGLVKEGKDLQKEAKETLIKSEQAHHRGDRFDLAELGVELVLVLCR